jgi:hypothetical protein
MSIEDEDRLSLLRRGLREVLEAIERGQRTAEDDVPELRREVERLNVEISVIEARA